MPVFRTLVALLAVCIAIVIAFVALAWRSAIDPVAAQTQDFPPELVRRGAVLAALGDCSTCHTAPGGGSYAGGVAISTPFGTIYSTNITPDADTGIGRWPEEAFRRALREGVDREGRQLYPAFPYDHFTLASDDDIHALYAYAMTREPVRATAHANDLAFPFGIRPLLAGWKLLFLRQGPYEPDPAQSAQWNRGAYLVEGLAHCGACHTPRNSLGAEQQKNRFGGGEAQGWSAYALNQASPAPVRWNERSLAFYLRNGWDKNHGVAHGAMTPVIDNLAALPDSDIQAIAGYMSDFAALSAGSIEVSRHSGVADTDRSPGVLIYQAACLGCHDGVRPLPFGGADLALSTAPSAPDPRNIINVVLWGIPAADSKHSPIMPGFASALTDRQIADLLGHVRSAFGINQPWSDIEKSVRDARNGVTPVEVFPAPGIDPARAAAGQVADQHEAK